MFGEAFEGEIEAGRLDYKRSLETTKPKSWLKKPGIVPLPPISKSLPSLSSISWSVIFFISSSEMPSIFLKSYYILILTQ